METVTQSLHRLTSFTWGWYEPSREDDDLEWSVPVDDPRVVRDLEPNDLERFPWFFKRYARTLPRVPLPRGLPATTASAVAVLAGTADVARIELDLAHLSRLLHLSAGVVRTTETPHTTWLFRAAGSAGARFPLDVYVAVPDGYGVPAGRALVRPARPRARAGRASAQRRRTGPRRHRRPVAHRVALPRARIPPRLLGRRHDALAAARGGRFRRAGGRTPHPLPGRRGRRTRRRGRRTRVAGGRRRARGRHARARGDRTGRGRSGRRCTSRVPARHGGAAGGRARRARGVVGPRCAGRGLGQGVRSARDGRARARVAEVDGSGPRPAGHRAAHVHGRGAARRRAPSLRCGPRRRRGRTGRLPLAGPFLAEARRRDAERALPGEHGTGTGSRCGVRRHRCDGRGRARRPGVPRGSTRRRPGRGPAPPARVRARRERLRETFIDGEVPALLGEPLDGLLFTCVGVPEYRAAAGGPPGAPTSIRTVTPRMQDQGEKAPPES